LPNKQFDGVIPAESERVISSSVAEIETRVNHQHCGNDLFGRTTAISGWRVKSIDVKTRTTAIPLHGFVQVSR